jgi:hypothetical protein
MAKMYPKWRKVPKIAKSTQNYKRLHKLLGVYMGTSRGLISDYLGTTWGLLRDYWDTTWAIVGDYRETTLDRIILN